MKKLIFFTALLISSLAFSQTEINIVGDSELLYIRNTQDPNDAGNWYPSARIKWRIDKTGSFDKIFLRYINNDPQGSPLNGPLFYRPEDLLDPADSLAFSSSTEVENWLKDRVGKSKAAGIGSGVLADASIDEIKLDVSVNATLDLADSATQPGDNISTLTNDSGFTGDQTSIVGITGTKAEFDTAVTDGNILYVGDADITGTANVTSAGALMDSEVTNLADVKAFDTVDYVATTVLSTGTAIDIGVNSQYNTTTANAATTYTLTNITAGKEATLFINAASEPVVTGATKFPNTAAFIVSTNMLLTITIIGTTPKYFFTEF